MPKSIPRFQILKRDDFRCVYCGKRATDVELHIDHVIPRSRGGGNETWNLATSCIPCNMSKGTSLPSEELIKDLRSLDACWHYPDRAAEYHSCHSCGIPVLIEPEDDPEHDYCETCNRLACMAYEAGSGVPLR